jgi:hypothetical protein
LRTRAYLVVGLFAGCASSSLSTHRLPQQQNFETGLPPGWVASPTGVSVSSDRAFSGGHSLKITSQAGRGRHYISYDLQQLPEPAEELYGTAMLYLESTGGGDFTLVQAEGGPKPESGAPGDASVAYRARVDGRHDHLMANYDTRGSRKPWGTDCWKQPAFDPATATAPAADYLLPKNEWACLRWHFDARRNQLEFWLNDSPLTQIRVDQTGDGCLAQDQNGIWHGPAAFEWLHLGVEQYHAGAGAHTLYLDNMTVDTQPTRCPVQGQ